MKRKLFLLVLLFTSSISIKAQEDAFFDTLIIGENYSINNINYNCLDINIKEARKIFGDPDASKWYKGGFVYPYIRCSDYYYYGGVSVSYIGKKNRMILESFCVENLPYVASKIQLSFFPEKDLNIFTFADLISALNVSETDINTVKEKLYKDTMSSKTENRLFSNAYGYKIISLWTKNQKIHVSFISEKNITYDDLLNFRLFSISISFKKCEDEIKFFDALVINYVFYSEEKLDFYQKTKWYSSLEEALIFPDIVHYLVISVKSDRQSLDTLTTFNNLEKLRISGKKLKHIPEVIGELQSLKSLTITFTKSTNLPKSLTMLKNLNHLDIGNNEFKSLPQSIGSLSNLTWLAGEYNKLESLPQSIGKLENIRVLDLHNNKIRCLPESIGDLKNLSQLELYSNKLSTLPDSIGKLENLKYLDLHNNKIRCLPKSMGELTKLSQLGLYNNKLETLPESIGNLVNIRIIGLGKNNLKFLPESIGNLKSLKVLDLHNNSLSELPESISQLNNLKWLILYGNNFSKQEREKINLLLPACKIVFDKDKEFVLDFMEKCQFWE